MTTRVNLVRNLSTTKELPVSTGTKLLGINRTSVYYGGLPVSQKELECKVIIDHLHTITYIPMKHGFLYLTAIIDWYSRCIACWDIDDTLDTTMVINACKKAFKAARPLIINSDQGSQFTSKKYINLY